MHLHRATVNYRDITVAHWYERNALLSKSSSLECVCDLLACSAFANVPVETFITPHLASVKEVVRGVDCSLLLWKCWISFPLQGLHQYTDRVNLSMVAVRQQIR